MIRDLGQILARLCNLQSGGFTRTVKITGAQVGADGAAYATGDVIGDKSPIEIELTRGQTGTCVIQTVVIRDLSKQSSALDLLVFDSLPTGTFTDNSACDIADADITKVAGVISVAAADYASFNDNSVATVRNIGLAIQSQESTKTKVWIVPVSRGTPTYVADELSISLTVLQD